MRPNQYANSVTVSSTGDSYQFGFRQTFLKVNNDGPKPCYVSFRSTVATTGDYALSSGDNIQFTAIMCDQISLVATSSGGTTRVLALG